MSEHLAPNTSPESLPEAGAASLAELVTARLDNSRLAAGPRALIEAALGERDESVAVTPGRIYLGEVAVTAFRGIGERAWLKLSPKPGVTLVVGRNGSGKTSFAAGLETAFTGTSTQWDGSNPESRRHWRNLHHDEAPKVEVKLCIEGDERPSTLTRTWTGDEVTDSTASFKRPGHPACDLAEVGWTQALVGYRPFLPYTDLGKMIGGKHSERYDALASILGLGRLTAADNRLAETEKELKGALRAVEHEVAELVQSLADLDDPRAKEAIAALASATAPDLDTLAALVAGSPVTDDARLDRLRATAAIVGPDLDEVDRALTRLREAAAVQEDVRATGAETALHRAELLAMALEHRRRHADEDTCPVCGSPRPLDEAWAEGAAEQVDRLREEAAAARAAREALAGAVDAVRYCVRPAPLGVPEALVDPWREWVACRDILDPKQLADRAFTAAVVLDDACKVLRGEAVQDLERLNADWRRCVVRLAGWLDRARPAHAAKPRLSDLRKARQWLRVAMGDLRDERLRPFTDHSQRVWEELRQQSSVDLRDVHLSGSDKATVRKLVMDVSVDGRDASALGVMSQGELHSLALALFLPRAAASESPFGFVVIDDPVQSMDPAKVHGLAKTLHDLGATRQVVVFTHDTRLQRAFQTQELPVTVVSVERGEASKVRVTTATDPVSAALEDARALAQTENLPAEAMSHVLPSLCRTALEAAFTEAAWLRLHRAGWPEHEVSAAVAGAVKLKEIAALGLFGDARRGSDVNRAIRERCGGPAVADFHRCQDGAHPGGASIPSPRAFVDAITAIAAIVRKPEEERP